MSAEPIVLLLGPSGSGKSKLREWLAEDLRFLDYEIDRFPELVDGIDFYGLRDPWNAVSFGNVTPLAMELRSRARVAGRDGAVLSFPSGVILPGHILSGFEEEGVFAVIPFGTQEECLRAFLDRERRRENPLTLEHWTRNNRYTFERFASAEMGRFRLGTFRANARRSRAELVAEVRRRIEMMSAM